MTPKARLQVDLPNERSSQGTATVRSRNIQFQVEQAVARATNWLLSAQTQDGYWWAELEADTTLESDYILYLHILGQLESEKTAKLANYIRHKQLPDKSAPRMASTQRAAEAAARSTWRGESA